MPIPGKTWETFEARSSYFKGTTKTIQILHNTLATAHSNLIPECLKLDPPLKTRASFYMRQTFHILHVLQNMPLRCRQHQFISTTSLESASFR